MQIRITLLIVSFIYIMLTSIVYFSKNRINNSENAVYEKLLSITPIGLLLELGCNITAIYKMNDLVSSIISRLYLIFILVWLATFTLYILTITKYKGDKLIEYKNSKIRKSIIIGSISSILLLIFLPIDFVLEKNSAYLGGIGIVFLLVITFILIILDFILFIKYFKNMTFREKVPMLLLLLLIGGLLLVNNIAPEIQIISSSFALITVIMYFTIENPDIKLSKELEYTKELLDKRNELASNTINNLIISIKEPLTEIVNFSNKKINKNNISLSLEEIKELQKTTLSLVDKVNKVMDITRIESSDYSIKERKYQTSNLIDNIKGILEKNNKEVNYEISTLPKVLYGSDINIVQTFSYLVDFISKNFENYILSIKISNLLVRNKCHLKFSLVVDSKYNNLNMYEKDNKYTLSNKSIEYEIYEKLIDLQRGHNFISKDGSKVIFEFSLYQRQEEVKEINDNEEIEYFDASDKNVLVALNSHNDIRNLSELLMNYNVNITTAGSVNELNELLSSNKTFDLVFLSDTIYGIDNYDIKNINDFKRVVNKLSLVAGYKLDIVLVTLNNYQKENIEYLTLPISKTKLDDVLVKYLNED